MFTQQNLNLLALIIGFLALGLAIYSIIALHPLNKLRKTFFSGRSGADLEAVIHTLHQELQNLREDHLVLENALSTLQHHFGFAIQKIGIVRFNPFGDDGGNFSFCLALLDSHNTGVVLTSMHGRQQNRIYTKKIQDGNSEVPLTTEEEQAITEANYKLQITNTK